MPVHLGSMGESIQTVIQENKGRMQPGDVFVLNDPYHGGTHLPDITVITPVYLDGHADPVFYVGSRGHHADVGGLTPGSMPPFSTRIEEEGVQINNVKLVEAGHLREAEMVALLQSGEYPSRNPAQNMADLKAQIAANEKGVQELRRMVDQFGLDVVQAYMRHVQGQRGRVGAPCHHAPQRRDVHFPPWTTGRRSKWRCASMPQTARPRSTSPAPALSSQTTSMPPGRCAWRPCSTCSAVWWTTTSR